MSQEKPAQNGDKGEVEPIFEDELHNLKALLASDWLKDACLEKSVEDTKHQGQYESNENQLVRKIGCNISKLGQAVHWTDHTPEGTELRAVGRCGAGAKPGTPKFQKVKEELIITRLNTRKKPTPPPPVEVAAPAGPGRPPGAPRGAVPPVPGSQAGPGRAPGRKAS